MPYIYFPPCKPVPEGATEETRRQMYFDHIDLILEMNPGCFLPLGVHRRWWNLKAEHPLTRLLGTRFIPGEVQPDGIKRHIG